MAVDEVLKYIATNEIKWIDLQFSDVNGNLHRVTISNKELDEDTFVKGIAAADLRDVFGNSESSDIILRPDSDSMARLPWEPSTIRLICDIVTARKGERYLKDSRYAVERMETNLEAVGIKTAKLGTGVEFYLLDTVTVDRTTEGRGSGALLDSREANWSPSVLSAGRGAFVTQPNDTLYAARTQLSETLEENFGFLVDSHHHGRSQTGQQSLDFHEYSPKLAADGLITMRQVAKVMASTVNAVATFMPYPLQGEKGSMLKISLSMWKTAENNLFYDANDDYAQLSQTARYYIGGILEHAAALCLFTCPTVNSYKRLAADVHVMGWSRDNRNAIVQAPHLRKNAKESKRVDFLGADPSVNPYLAYAAVVAAGLDGIKAKIDPGDPLEPGESEAKKRKWKSLPTSLYQSIEVLESDPKFIKGIIPSELLGDYLDIKLLEHKEGSKALSIWEMKKYLSM